MTDFLQIGHIEQPSPTLTPQQTARIEKTAKEFEALVLSQLLAPIFAGVEKSNLMGEGQETDAFQTMLQDEYAKSMVARGGFGIADQIKTSLIQLQAAQQQTVHTNPIPQSAKHDS